MLPWPPGLPGLPGVAVATILRKSFGTVYADVPTVLNVCVPVMIAMPRIAFNPVNS